jgi:hypothetical protein
MEMSDREKEIAVKEHLFYEKQQVLIQDKEELIRLKTDLRKDTLRSIFEDFLNQQRKDIREFVYLNDALLYAAVCSYYHDVHRYKEYSGSEWINNYKQAAYTIKWIAKFRPIQIKEYAGEYSKALLDINLSFAISCAFVFMNDDVVDVIMKEKGEVDQRNKQAGSNKERSFYDRLLYIIRYRPLSGKQLISMFETLELACK